MKQLFKYSAALLLLAVLAACAGQSTKQILLNGCRTYDSTLRMLTVYKSQGKLSAAQISQVDEWRPTLNSVCQGPPPTNPQTALDTLEQGLFVLSGIQTGVPR